MSKLQSIYALLNTKNNKFYVGRSNNVEYRFATHKNKLNRNEHVNKHLQNAWNEDKEYFKLIILHEINLNNKQYELNIAQSIEQAYLDEFMHKDILYNISCSSRTGIMFGEDNHFYGKKHNAQTIQLMSLKRKQQIADGSYQISNAKKVKIFNHTYDSITQAYKLTPYSKYAIRKNCNDPNNHDFNFII